MLAAETEYEHVVVNDDGVAMIAGTTMKVLEIVLEHIGYGWNAQELQDQHPYLSLAQVHSALAYYWDHGEELERQIREREARAEALRAVLRVSPLQEKLARRRNGS